MEICKDCGGIGTIRIEDSSGIKVCEECGLIYDQIQLSEGIEYNNNAFNNGRFICGEGPQYKTPSGAHWFENYAKNEVKKQCKLLCSHVQMNDLMTGMIENKVGQYMQNKWSSGKKRDLVICSCIYLVAREENYPLTLLDISRATRYNVFLIGAMYSKVKRELGVDLEDLDHSIYIEKTLRRLNLKIDEGQLLSLGQNGLDIIDLVKENVVPGRKPSILIGAVVLILCQMNEIKVDAKAIAEELSVAKVSLINRKNELREYLVQIGKTILPFAQLISKSNIMKYIPDIVRHFQLIKQLEQKQVEERSFEEAECKYQTKKDSPMDRIRKNLSLGPPSLRVHQMKRENRRKKVEKAKQRLLIILSKGKKEDSESEDSMDGEDLQIERMLLEGMQEDKIIDGEDPTFEPVYRPHLNDTQLGEFDIPEKELSLYIRSPQEVETLQRISNLTQ
eukprot:TRINITY_DN7640_c0_g1_i2.p1 TRINITY_DN7640_c0_g1~~TRINITY_DN7640_c0_g1_i2.p1  ORF type:complete len:448 (+),score=145.90 TRINITY_DN7640_c0_g1_i2:177-1520(+)